MPDERQPRGVGVALRDPFAWSDLATLTREAESLGYAALFMPEIASRDTLAALTGLAGETTSMLLGPGVAPLPSRSPQLLAMAAATVSERSGGRLLLGLGTGPAVPGALARLRATVLAFREAFATGSADLDGARIGLQLVPPRVPIWIAALGPKAVALAGEVADGVLLNWCTPERVAEARAAVRAAAEAAGRDPDDVTIGVYVRAAIEDPDGERLAVAASAEYASYPAYRRQFEAMGIDPGDAAAVARGVCLLGEAGAARERLRAYTEAGADLPVIYPVLSPTEPNPARASATLRSLAPGELA